MATFYVLYALFCVAFFKMDELVRVETALEGQEPTSLFGFKTLRAVGVEVGRDVGFRRTVSVLFVFFGSGLMSLSWKVCLCAESRESLSRLSFLTRKTPESHQTH